MGLMALCGALLAGTATSRAVLGPSFYSPRTLAWTMVLALLAALWTAHHSMRRTAGSGAVGGAVTGALTGALCGAGLGLFAAIHLIAENRDMIEAFVPVPLAWIAVLGSCLTGVVWGALLGLPLGAVALGVARAILDGGRRPAGSAVRKDGGM